MKRADREYILTTEQGFERMYEEYFPKIYNFIYYQILERDAVEDMVSDVFLKVAANAHSFDPGRASFKTWIYRIAKNAVADYYRSKRPVLSLDDEETEIDVTISFEEQLERISTERRKAVFRALTQLTRRERLMVYYKYFEDYNNRQIAVMLEMNESTVGTVLSRTLKKLRTPELAAFLPD